MLNVHSWQFTIMYINCHLPYSLVVGQTDTTGLSAGAVLELSVEVDVGPALRTTLYFLLFRLTHHPLGAVRAVGILAFGYANTCRFHGVFQTDD
jgi:hypothetical protein